ncbi:MAG: ADP-ribosylglycohydrolase family protein [Anaerovoracaceae bacterium]|jgi:ADP-ribosyl-[dinitrogen reductase] hydrolase
MLGAIVGDIVGSRFEFNNHSSKDFELFGDGCFVTDDSIMSLAVAKAIMEAFKLKATNDQEYDQDFHNKLSDLIVKYMQEIGRKYPNCGFGGMFHKWVFSDNPKPYNSFGNGAAMRISAAGFIAANESEARQLAETVTAVTHDHEEGIKGAEATAVAIYLARKGATKKEIREQIVRDYYLLDFKIDDIRATYHFNETCQETVPQAIQCFLESTSFEDAIRTAISLGGDSDTIGAITGAIAGAYYGVPEEIKKKALTYLDDEFRVIYDEWNAFMPPCGEQFRMLTKYIGKLSPKLSIVSDYIHEPPYEMLFNEFYEEFMHFIWISYPQYCEDGVFYTSILRDKDFSEAEVAKGNVDDLDALTLLAIIHRELISGAHWNYNEIDSFKDVKFVRWLKRLKDIDWQKAKRCITEVKLELGGMGGYNTYNVTITDTTASFTIGVPNYGDIDASIDERKKISDIRKDLESMHFEYWLPSYPQEGEMLVCDGEQWSLIVKYNDGTTLDISGDNTYPENWNVLLEFFGIDCDDDEDNTKRQPGEVIYCSVSLDGGKTYYYTTEDESIEIGDEVIVPVGADGNELTGVVKDIEYFKPEGVPFPLESTKKITGKASELGDGKKN